MLATRTGFSVPAAWRTAGARAKPAAVMALVDRKSRRVNNGLRIMVVFLSFFFDGRRRSLSF
jgi:hypothetical protein